MGNETRLEIPKGKAIGKITHYFGKIGVGVIELSDKLNAGDEIVVSGRGQEFEQAVDSMQVEHERIQSAKKGQAVGLKLVEPAKAGDTVFLKG